MAIVCPYCLNNLKDILGANGVNRSCNLCDGAYSGDLVSNLMLRIGKIPKCTSTKGCLGHYSALKCSVCGTLLPSDILQYDRYLRFSVVAPSGAGKTVFITTMTDELKKSRALNMFVSHMNRETLDYYMDNYQSLYENCRIARATMAGEVHPMQWKLQDLGRQTNTKTPCYSLTMFDGAGEDQENLDPIISRYISGSKMIMLLLDPTKLAGVMAQMTDEEYRLAGGQGMRVSSEFTQNFIMELVNYLKTACGVNVKYKLKIPVAVVFGKIDAVKRHLGSAMVLQPSGHAARGCFIQSEADQIHHEIAGWMDNCGDNLNRLFDANFEHWKYFGVSSFGNLPLDRTKIQRPMPLRVLDPLIWNLSMEGILKTV